MRQYVLKRLLLMFPTMFFIAFIVFGIIQLAPGKPGSDLLVNSMSPLQEQQSGYRIFKQQFHLDKPIFLNLRFLLADQDILYLLQVMAGYHQSGAKDLIKASEAIEDYGLDIVPHLARILQSSPSPEIRDIILHVFPLNAKRPLLHIYGVAQNTEAVLLNREIEWENKLLVRLTFKEDMTEQERENLRQRVISYYRSIMHRWDYSFMDCCKMAFLQTRFSRYIANLLSLDFGISHVDKRPVLPKIMQRLRYSVLLSGLSILIAYLIAIPLGILSAVKSGSFFDRLSTIVLFMLYSLPSFFVGTMLLYYFSVGGDHWHVFPTGGIISPHAHRLTVLQKLFDAIQHLILPLICLSYVSLASISRYTRTGLIDVLHADYIKTARAKGLSEKVVIGKHVLRNGIIPIITILGSTFPMIVSGSVIIEVIFNIPGIGLEAYNAVLLRDYNAIMAIQLISAFFTLVGILISDILYAVVDPRITYATVS